MSVAVQPRHTAGPKEFIILIAALMSIVAISIDAMLPALGIIGRDLQVIHPNQAQYIISFVFAGLAAGQLVSGPLSDAWGRKKVLYASVSLYLVGSFICLSADTITVMLAGRFIQGLGMSGPYVSTMSIVRDTYSGRDMARIMSLVMTIFIMVPVFAPAIGQGVLFVASWRYIFVLYIIYSVSILVWVGFRLKETLPPPDRIPYKLSNVLQGAKTVLKSRVTVTYTLALGCIFGSLIGDLNSIQQVFHEQFGVGDMFAVYFGLQALAFGAASLLNSRLVDRLGMRYICLRMTAIMALASLAFLIMNILIPIAFWMFFSYGVVLLLCIGMLFGNLNALAMEPMGHIAGMASALIGSGSSIIGLTLGTIIGQLYDGTLIPLTAGFLILSTMAFLLMLFEKTCK